jgi:hypothetical protein
MILGKQAMPTVNLMGSGNKFGNAVTVNLLVLKTVAVDGQYNGK